MRNRLVWCVCIRVATLSLKSFLQRHACKTPVYIFLPLFLCRRLEYTRDQLLEFKKQIDDKVGQGHSEEHGGGFGGFGGFGGGGGTEVSSKIDLFLMSAAVIFLPKLV